MIFFYLALLLGAHHSSKEIIIKERWLES